MKFLLVDDDPALASAVEQLLAEHHYVMDLATDGITGQDMAEAFDYDLILLDWMLPKLDGVQLCKYLRNQGNNTPIILMTARDASTDKVNGLDAGADDYLVKPFEYQELLARMRALLRRAEGIVTPILRWGDLSLDPRSAQVTYRDIEIAITPKEYSLLELFLRNPNRTFSLDDLLDRVWSFDDSPHVGSVRTHIKGLRQKLKKVGLPGIFTTVYGLGYRLKPFEMNSPLTAETALAPLTATTLTATADSSPSISFQNSSKKPSQPPPEQPPKSLPTDRLDTSALWQSMSESYSQRVALIVNTIRSLQPGPIDQSIRQQTLAQAHSLAGSLGSFGFKSVTVQCRAIENMLRDNDHLSAEQINQLTVFITQVQQTLAAGLSPPLAVSATATATEIDTDAATDSSLARLSPPLERVPFASASVSLPAQQIPAQLSQLLIVKSHGKPSSGTLCPRDESWLQTLTTLAANHRMQVSTVEDVSQAKSAIAQQRPDIVVLDSYSSPELPHGDSDEFRLLAELQIMRPSIPTLVLTAADSFENRVRVARMGVAGLLQFPVSPTELLETASQLSQRSAASAAKLLIVDDDPAMLALLQDLLHPWGFQLQLLSDPQRFWQTLEHFEPDLIILDIEMPQLSGFDLCQVLRNAPVWNEIPVLFLSGHTDAATIQQVFSVGADDYVRKPVVAPELIARVLSWLERSRIRRFRSDIDSLTGVANRQKSTQWLVRLLKLAQRQQQPLCFALIDLDHFKKINDKYGHPIGDRVLRNFGESLRATFRSEDIVGRWGGEEFIVGLYGMNRQEGTDRLRQFSNAWQQEHLCVVMPTDHYLTDSRNGSEQKYLEQQGLEQYGSEQHDPKQYDLEQQGPKQQNPEQQEPDSHHITTTFTAGVAVYPTDGADLHGLYRVADTALYQAKNAGRNRVY